MSRPGLQRAQGLFESFRTGEDARVAMPPGRSVFESIDMVVPWEIRRVICISSLNAGELSQPTEIRGCVN